MNVDKIKQYVTVDNEQALLVIDANVQLGNVTIERITFTVDIVGEDNDYYNGDLAVHYTHALYDESIDDDEQDEAVLGVVESFYDGVYNDVVHKLLAKAGFSAEAAASVESSESGMQDLLRASFDANAIANEVRAALQQ